MRQWDGKHAALTTMGLMMMTMLSAKAVWRKWSHHMTQVMFHMTLVIFHMTTGDVSWPTRLGSCVAPFSSLMQ